MPQLVIKHSENKREIIYDYNQDTIPYDALYNIIHMLPVEIARIQEAKSEEVQNILRRYI